MGCCVSKEDIENKNFSIQFNDNHKIPNNHRNSSLHDNNTEKVSKNCNSNNKSLLGIDKSFISVNDKNLNSEKKAAKFSSINAGYRNNPDLDNLSPFETFHDQSCGNNTNILFSEQEQLETAKDTNVFCDTDYIQNKNKLADIPRSQKLIKMKSHNKLKKDDFLVEQTSNNEYLQNSPKANSTFLKDIVKTDYNIKPSRFNGLTMNTDENQINIDYINTDNGHAQVISNYKDNYININLQSKFESSINEYSGSKKDVKPKMKNSLKKVFEGRLNNIKRRTMMSPVNVDVSSLLQNHMTTVDQIKNNCNYKKDKESIFQKSTEESKKINSINFNETNPVNNNIAKNFSKYKHLFGDNSKYSEISTSNNNISISNLNLNKQNSGNFSSNQRKYSSKFPEDMTFKSKIKANLLK